MGTGIGHVDADHPGLHLRLETSRRAAVVREDGDAVGKRTFVDQPERLVYVSARTTLSTGRRLVGIIDIKGVTAIEEAMVPRKTAFVPGHPQRAPFLSELGRRRPVLARVGSTRA